MCNSAESVQQHNGGTHCIINRKLYIPADRINGLLTTGSPSSASNAP